MSAVMEETTPDTYRRQLVARLEAAKGIPAERAQVERKAAQVRDAFKKAREAYVKEMDETNAKLDALTQRQTATHDIRQELLRSAPPELHARAAEIGRQILELENATRRTHEDLLRTRGAIDQKEAAVARAPSPEAKEYIRKEIAPLKVQLDRITERKENDAAELAALKEERAEIESRMLEV